LKSVSIEEKREHGMYVHTKYHTRYKTSIYVHTYQLQDGITRATQYGKSTSTPAREGKVARVPRRLLIIFF